MTEENVKFDIGLNIHLVAFNLPKNVIKDHEEIRVSITTLPEEKKQHFKLQAKKMKNSNHVFSINITNQTKKVIMVFRKKSLLYNDPIIASTIIHQTDFPTLPPGMSSFNCDPISTDIKNLEIYYPLQKQIREMRKHTHDQKFPAQPADKTAKINRKIIGNMQVQMSFTTPYPDLEVANEKFRKSHRNGESNSNFNDAHGSYSKNNYEMITNENSHNNF